MARKRTARPDSMAGRLGLRIEALRKDRGLTAPELADAAGVAASTVIKIEQGARYPGLDTVVAIGHALGLSAAELLKGVSDWTMRPQATSKRANANH